MPLTPTDCRDLSDAKRRIHLGVVLPAGLAGVRHRGYRHADAKQ